jgi:hypothetical protein
MVSEMEDEEASPAASPAADADADAPTAAEPEAEAEPEEETEDSGAYKAPPAPPAYAAAEDAAADHKAAAIAYDETGDLSNAILAFAAAAKHAPAVAANWNNLAVAMEGEVGLPIWIFQYSDEQKAAHRATVLEAFAKVLAIDPANADAKEETARIQQEVAATAEAQAGVQAKLAADRAKNEAAVSAKRAAIRAKIDAEQAEAAGSSWGTAGQSSGYSYEEGDAEADHLTEAIRRDEAGDMAAAVASFRAYTRFHPESGKVRA